MGEQATNNVTRDALSLAEVSLSFGQIFQGLIEDGLPTNETFPHWIDVFQKFDDSLRKRIVGKGPVACFVIGNHICWFAGEKIVSFTEQLKDIPNLYTPLRATNYLTVSEVYSQLRPAAQTCCGQLCQALTDLKLTRSFTNGEDIYGCKELDELNQRIKKALGLLSEAYQGVLVVEDPLGGRTDLAGAELVKSMERQKLLHLWELLEIAIPRMKENDKEPINQIMEQLLQPGEPLAGKFDPNVDSDQGFVFKVRQLLGRRLENRDRALLSETRSTLLRSRREFYTIRAFISTYHQMILAPRAYEEPRAAVQYAILSKQRRYASRACRELADQSPAEMAALQQAENQANEGEAALDPDRILQELREHGDITPPKLWSESVARVEQKQEQQQKASKRTGMHIQHR